MMNSVADFRSGGWRRMALMLVACALILRVLIPAGWMPAPVPDGLTLRWCTESVGQSDTRAQAQAVLADALGNTAAPKHKPSPDHPCAFSAAASVLDSVQAPRAEHPEAAAAMVPVPAYRLLPGRGLAAPPPFATGPPLQA